DVAQGVVVDVDLLTATDLGPLQAVEVVVAEVLLYRLVTTVVIAVQQVAQIVPVVFLVLQLPEQAIEEVGALESTTLTPLAPDLLTP
ncbi:hypothetical protein, partial [Marinimicrobium sp. ARAG 43.8]|uniref:hypothetical protein n=1 Tax=Marinimicrobium sp. ARAG 43.8 TaxID=3418719 RepID=UPI003CF1BD63